ncbi:MAG: TonB-dependent receptor, partial [Caulobacteraceae bacterium]|nr:TonB-dependent receptor [Caulobacter sp.]
MELIPVAPAPPAPDQEVVVRAARLPDPAGDAAYSVVRVDPERLADATTLDGALKSVPGFSLYRRTSTLGANPTTQGVSLRAIAGSGASRALVTLDGVPQNDPFGGWVIWSALPSVAIGSAEIVRGAGAGPYGAGALTGVVRLDSPDDARGLSGEASGGELGFREGQAALGAAHGGTRVFLDAAGTESDGWIPVRAGRGAADRPLDLHAWSAAGRLEQDIGLATLAARVGGYEEERGAGVVNASSDASGLQGSLTLARQPTAQAWGWRLQGWADGSDLYNASATVSADRNISTPANVQYATPALGAGLNAALRRTTQAFSLELGGDLRAATGESRELFGWNAAQLAFSSTRKAGGETLVAGLYAEGTVRRGRWLLTGGVRADRWSQDGAERVEAARATGAVTLDTRPEGRSGVLPTGRLGL